MPTALKVKTLVRYPGTGAPWSSKLPGASVISLAARRYDGASGATTVNGGIPLQPGQLTAAQLGNVSIVEGSTERPIRVTALQGTHPDGSLRAIQVQTDLTFATSSEAKTLTLRLTVPPTAGTATATTINYAWMRQPRLLYCTDSAHMCRSRVFPLPLIPIDDPAVPSSWYTFLTTDMDALYEATYTRTLAGNNAGAEYDHPYEMACAFVSQVSARPTAAVQYLRRALAHYLNDSAGVTAADGLSSQVGTNVYLSFERFVPYCIPQSGSWTGFDDNPEGLTRSATDRSGAGAEWACRLLSSVAIYYLTGWQQAQLHTRYAGGWAWRELSAFSATMAASSGTARDMVRRRGLGAQVHHYLQNPASSYLFAPNPPAWDASNFMTPVNAWRNGADALAAVAPAPLTGVFGAANATNNPVQPVFQFATVAPYLLYQAYHMGVSSTVVGDRIKSVADFVQAICGAPVYKAVSNWDVYVSPYDAFGDSDQIIDLQMMQTLNMAYTFAYTGNTSYRDWVDRVATAKHSLEPGGAAYQTMGGFKLWGEQFLNAHHALAYRSGVAHSGWWN
jgi:hypothetical protein